MSLERELRKDWDSVYYPAPEPIVEQAPVQDTGAIQLAEVGSRNLPESAYTPDPAARMESFDPTMKQVASDKLQSILESLGVDRYKARQNAQSFLGGPSSNFPFSMGLVDALANLPGIGTAVGTAMLPMYVEEGALEMQKGLEFAKRGDFVNAAISTIAGAVDVLPGGQAATKIGKGVVKKAKSLVKEAK